MSFCRITGRSRGLPKPNYFPLLPPISPADAKRFCRITSKSYGLPSHHYAPVILVKNTDHAGKCHITTKAEGQPTHHFLPSCGGDYKRHVLASEYRYVFPILDSSSQEQKMLTEVLEGKNGMSTLRDHFVYAVEEHCCSLVIPANLEAAVRDGDVRNLMIAKNSDTILLRLRQGCDVTLDVKDMIMEDVDLWEGKGPSEDAQKLWEMDDVASKKRKKRKSNGLKLVKKLFEEKERVAEMQEMEITQKIIAKKVKLELSNTTSRKPSETEGAESKVFSEYKIMSWNNFVPDFSQANTCMYIAHGDWRDLAKPIVESWDWEVVEREMSKLSGVLPITKLPTPIVASINNVDLSASVPGIIQQQLIGTKGEIAGFDPVMAVVPLIPFMKVPEDEVQKAIQNIRKDLLCKTVGVREVLSNTNTPYSLPTSEEIQVIMENLEKGHEIQIFRKEEFINGLVLDIATEQKFVPGQFVETSHGQVFVPGQTLQTNSGAKFVPGITVNTPDGPVLIPGQKVIAEDNTGKKTPVFVAGQNLTTRDGETFVAGQTVQTPEGPKFLPGQTVYTNEGPKFVAGQVVAKEDEFIFFPGQTVMTEEGPEFILGQTISALHGNVMFIPGLNVKTNKDWEFVPGQVVKSRTAQVKFVPGRTFVLGNDTKFIPGQTVMDETKQVHQFVPGITVSDECQTLRFVPGTTVDTTQGPQFLEGQIIEIGSSKMFIPGKTSIAEDNSALLFSTAKCITDVIVKNIDLDIPIIHPSSLKILYTGHKKKRIFGHLLQTADGVEFFPGLTEGLPVGKIVPGELIHSDVGEIQFVPGIVSEERKFIPGQMLLTDNGEQFVPGQVVDTKEGLKFVPGQVVDTHLGPKFVPGQTVETCDGLRFLPGQVVETKLGPTFIPGQVISTKYEGSRFIPGQVVDTSKGPRFVPGRVVETFDSVTFVPGHIVNTDEGLHFVAPNLQDSPSGELQFSVQGFEVLPEELNLLQPQTAVAPCFSKRKEMAIDSKMLRQLSEAGMSVGRQVPVDIPAVDVNTVVTESMMKIALKITENLGLKGKCAMKMGEVFYMIAHGGSEMLDFIKRNKHSKFCIKRDHVIEKESSVKVLVQAVFKAIILNAEEQCLKSKEKLMSIIGSIFEDVFKCVTNTEYKVMESLVDSLHRFIATPGNVAVICDKLTNEHNTRTGILNNELQDRKDDSAVESLMALLQNCNCKNENTLAAAFDDISVVCKEIESIKTDLSEQIKVTEIQRAVITVIQEISDEWDSELLDQVDVKELLLQAVGLAESLGMANTAASLLEVLSNPQSSQVFYEDPLVASLLRRLVIMKQLADDRPGQVSALEHFKRNAGSHAFVTTVEELVQKSTSLMRLQEEDIELPLESSDDIPSILFQNSLAMEEFIRSRKHYGPLLILKRGLQAVVPREAAHAILTGQIAYSVLDENGIRRFQPLHVLSALRLPRPASNWFPMYSCPLGKDSLLSTATNVTESVTPASGSVEDLSQDVTTTSGTTQHSLDTSLCSDSILNYSTDNTSSIHRTACSHSTN